MSVSPHARQLSPRRFALDKETGKHSQIECYVYGPDEPIPAGKGVLIVTSTGDYDHRPVSVTATDDLDITARTEVARVRQSGIRVGRVEMRMQEDFEANRYIVAMGLRERCRELKYPLLPERGSP